jgi:predicted Holliday junction resolvase-like endonuclease
MDNSWETIFICLLTIIVLILLNLTVDNRHEIKRLKNEVFMNRAEINQLIEEVRSSSEFDGRM